MASPDDICFKGNSDLECNCTSSPPELPEKPSFCIEPICTTTTPTPPTGTSTETPTTTPEIITDIASPVGTTPYDDGTPPVDTSSSTTNTGIFTSDGTTSNPTSLDRTEYTRSNGITATSSDPPLETISRATSSNPPPETFSTATSSNPPPETFSTGLPNGTSPNSTETIPLITTEGTTKMVYCDPNYSYDDNDVCSNAAPVPAGLIAGCVCGAVAVIVLCGILIWYLWKKKKGCFAPEGSGGKNGSKECLPDHEQNNVELMKVEKRGTVILTPVTNPTVTPGPLPPIPKSEITPVNHPSTEEASPSHSAGSKPGSATSKKKKKTSRTNRVSPEPIPGPTSPTGGGGG